MNIFILDANLALNAQAHCNKHIVKMPLEAAQITCTAMHLMGSSLGSQGYKPTHLNHPCCVWAAEDVTNLAYVVDYGLALCDEYGLRYKRDHAARQVLRTARFLLPGDIQSLPELYAPALAIEYRTSNYSPRMSLDAVIAEYRNYYCLAKSHLAEWPAFRGAPAWFLPT